MNCVFLLHSNCTSRLIVILICSVYVHLSHCECILLSSSVVVCNIFDFTAMLRNEVGWFDEEENSADTLSMRLANDATFVRAAFSNRLSIFIQDSAAVVVAILIGMFLYWRLALVALATLPILTVSAVAQVRAISTCFL